MFCPREKWGESQKRKDVGMGRGRKETLAPNSLPKTILLNFNLPRMWSTSLARLKRNLRQSSILPSSMPIYRTGNLPFSSPVLLVACFNLSGMHALSDGPPERLFMLIFPRDTAVIPKIHHFSKKEEK